MGIFAYVNMQRRSITSPGSQSECQGKTGNHRLYWRQEVGISQGKRGPCMPVLLRGRVLWLGSPQAFSFLLPPQDCVTELISTWPVGPMGSQRPHPLASLPLDTMSSLDSSFKECRGKQGTTWKKNGALEDRPKERHS